MPRRLVSLFSREVKGVHEVAYLLAFFTLGSQVVALLRDRLLAHLFGAGATLDVFYAAFRIPDTLYVFFASMLSLFVLIPFLEERMHTSKEAVQKFLSSVFSFFLMVFGAFVFCLFFFVPTITTFLYPHFSPSMHRELVSMVYILLLQPFILGVSSIMTAYVQVRGRFILYAIAPILYNVGIVWGVLFLYPSLGIAGLAWGVVAGAVLHCAIQAPYLAVQGVFPKLIMPVWSEVRALVRISIPRALTLSMQYLTLLVLVALASFSSVGAITAFMFAYNLQSVPLAIVGASYSVAAFPKLARFFAQHEMDRFRELLLLAVRHILLWAFLATSLFFVLRAQIVRVVFGSGAFDWHDTMLTSALLALFVVSLAGQGLVVLLVRACYAGGKTWVPFFANIGGTLCTIGAGWFGLTHLISGDGAFMLETILHVPYILGGETLVLALAFSLGVWITAVALVVYIEMSIGGFVRPLLYPFFDACVSAGIGGLATYLALQVVAGILSTTTTFGVLLQGVIAGACGVVVWALILVALGNKDVERVWWALHQKITTRRMEEVRGEIDAGN